VEDASHCSGLSPPAFSSGNLTFELSRWRDGRCCMGFPDKSLVQLLPQANALYR
jgi:hypothetical protein